jgi:hypothetical protein
MAGAVVLVLTVLFAAPLTLGTYIMVQRSSRLGLMLWFGIVTLLFVAALAAGALALFIAPL